MIFPTSISKKITPNDQISHFVVYGCLINTYGAIYKGEPTLDCIA